MTSILGPALQAEKTAAVIRRLKRLERQKHLIRRKVDLQHMERMAQELRTQGENFSPADNDGTLLALIEHRLIKRLQKAAAFQSTQRAS